MLVWSIEKWIGLQQIVRDNPSCCLRCTPCCPIQVWFIISFWWAPYFLKWTLNNCWHILKPFSALFANAARSYSHCLWTGSAVKKKKRKLASEASLARADYVRGWAVFNPKSTLGPCAWRFFPRSPISWSGKNTNKQPLTSWCDQVFFYSSWFRSLFLLPRTPASTVWTWGIANLWHATGRLLYLTFPAFFFRLTVFTFT